MIKPYWGKTNYTVVRELNSFTLTGIDGVLLTHYHSNIKLVSFLQQLVFVLFNKFFNLKDRKWTIRFTL